MLSYILSLKKYSWGWGEGLVVKISDCSSRRPGSVFLELTWWFTTIYNAGSMDSDFCPVHTPSTDIQAGLHLK